MDKLNAEIQFYDGFVLGLEDVSWYRSAPPERAQNQADVNMPLPTLEERLQGLKDSMKDIDPESGKGYRIIGRIKGIERGLEVTAPTCAANCATPCSEAK